MPHLSQLQTPDQFVKTGEFSSQWFKRAMADYYKEGSCNFTIIGGVFVLLGNAGYLERGRYTRRDRRQDT